jgi:RHS repeat-associated protein
VSYDPGSQLRSDGRYSYTYDAHGRLTRREDRTSHAVTQYTWNGADQLTSVVMPDGTRSTYRYDAFGRRVESAGGGEVRHFVYADWNLLLAYRNDALDTAYTPGPYPDTLYELRHGGASYYPGFDARGSVTGLPDAGGDRVSTTQYSAFGGSQSTGFTDDGYTFTGHQRDADTGLYYARSRYYDPGTGRFLSPDPEPAVNTYAYCSGRPFEFTDPLGRTAASEKLTIECKASWPAAARASGYMKVVVIQAYAAAGKLSVKRGARTAAVKAAQKAFRIANKLGSGIDADHLVDLALNGPPSILWPLNSTINRSIGAQIGNQIRKLNPGDVIRKVIYEPCP